MNKQKERKEKTYHFKTVEQIADLVNEDNYKLIAKDFELWLEQVVQYDKLPKIIKGSLKFNKKIFGWIDDGKHEMSYSIKIEDE